jgi:DNA helicase HerA-like ATPase
MLVDDRIFMGVSTRPEYLLLKYGNRHGLITGATGTGKTVTLQWLRGGPPRYRGNAGPPPARRASNRESVGDAVIKSVARNVTGQLTRSLVRGILGSLARGL